VAQALAAKTAASNLAQIGHQEFKEFALHLAIAGPPSPQ
jgi:hypothetical protein